MSIASSGLASPLLCAGNLPSSSQSAFCPLARACEGEGEGNDAVMPITTAYDDTGDRHNNCPMQDQAGSAVRLELKSQIRRIVWVGLGGRQVMEDRLSGAAVACLSASLIRSMRCHVDDGRVNRVSDADGDGR